MVLSMLLGWSVWPIFLFSLRDSVGVRVLGQGSKLECADILHQSFLCCCAILTTGGPGSLCEFKMAVNIKDLYGTSGKRFKSINTR